MEPNVPEKSFAFIFSYVPDFSSEDGGRQQVPEKGWYHSTKLTTPSSRKL
jgi:hypothetical protein